MQCTLYFVLYSHLFCILFKFHNSASEIITVARESANTKVNSFESFSISMTSHAKEAGEVWPFVDLPDWSVRAQNLAELTKSYAILYTPIVETDQRQDWESYVQNNVQSWYQESIINENLSVNVTNLYTMKEIFALDITTNPPQPKPLANDTAPWLPVWQVYPLDPTFTTVNFNFLNGPRLNQAYNILRYTKKPALNFVQTPDGGRSQILTPIFDEVNNGKVELEMVGAIWALYEWSSYFENILTDETAEQLNLVVKNSCHEEDDVTYSVKGPDVSFLGYGDLHDTKFDDLEVNEPFLVIDYDQDKVPGDLCTPTVSLFLYPTNEMKQSFQTNTAAVYTSLIVVCIVYIIPLLICFCLSLF